MARMLRAWSLLAATAALSGCVAYPAPYYTYSPAGTYDRAWSAALGALDDTGVRVLAVDRNAGIARGTKDGAEVAVSVQRQADGTTRVQFDAQSPQLDPGLAQRLSTAYERRMGR